MGDFYLARLAQAPRREPGAIFKAEVDGVDCFIPVYSPAAVIDFLARPDCGERRLHVLTTHAGDLESCASAVALETPHPCATLLVASRDEAQTLETALLLEGDPHESEPNCVVVGKTPLIVAVWGAVAADRNAPAGAVLVVAGSLSAQSDDICAAEAERPQPRRCVYFHHQTRLRLSIMPELPPPPPLY